MDFHSVTKAILCWSISVPCAWALQPSQPNLEVPTETIIYKKTTIEVCISDENVTLDGLELATSELVSVLQNLDSDTHLVLSIEHLTKRNRAYDLIMDGVAKISAARQGDKKACAN